MSSLGEAGGDDEGEEEVHYKSRTTWTFRNNTTWAPLHGLSAEGIVLADRDGTGKDEVVIDFGATWGVWRYANDSAWSHLHPISPEGIVAGRFH